MSTPRPATLLLNSPEQTTEAALRLEPVLRAGDCVLLQGGLGAGKTHFARSIVQRRLEILGRYEDVPSPTFTLVQTYDVGEVEIWHADLYRISGPDDIFELGIEDAFETAITLIEWPDRLQNLAPKNALHLTLEIVESGRILTATGPEHLVAPIGANV